MRARVVKVWAAFLLGGCAASESVDAVEVRWISVFASDYDLELVPEFDPEVTTYTAQADGPEIVVHVEVTLSGGDADGLVVNGINGEPFGYRSWISAPDAGYAAPTTLDVEVELPDEAAARYTIDVTVP